MTLNRFLLILLINCTIVMQAIAQPVLSHTKTDEGIHFTLTKGILQIKICKNDLFRITYFPTNKVFDVQSASVVTNHFGKVQWKYTESTVNHLRYAHITTATNSIRIALETGALTFFDKNQQILLEEQATGRSMTPANVLGDSTYHAQQVFTAPANEAIYGLGQNQEGIMNFKDHYLRLQQFNTVIAMPFYYSNKGYGLFWNNASMTEFNPEKETLRFDIQASFDSHWALYKPQITGDYVFIVDGIHNSGSIKMTADELGMKDGFETRIQQDIIHVDYDVLPKCLAGRIRLEAGKEYELNIRGNIRNLYVKTPAMMGKTAFWSEVADVIDYYFMGGPTADEVIANYRDITGRAPMFPKWAYGFMQSRYTYNTQNLMLQAAKGYRDRKIPIDVVIQDMNYWEVTPQRNTWGSHLFDPKKYPNPRQMFTDLEEQYHVKTLVSVWPRINKDADLFSYFVDNHLALGVQDTKDRNTEGFTIENDQENVAVDPYNPASRKAYWTFVKDRLWDLGADGWWLDASEPEWGYDFRNSKTFAGTGARNLNTYSLMQTMGIYEGQRSVTNDKRVVIMTRSAFPGQQRFATQCWSGDIGITWQTLKQQIPSGLNFALSGMPYWSSDIGGFRPFMKTHSHNYQELVIRWFQFGTFSPMFRVHGCRSTELWQLGKQAEDIQVKFNQLRYLLMPYIYSLAGDVTHKHSTMMRALVMDFPTDTLVNNINDQFMFGKSLLVSPVLAYQARERSVYLPRHAGGWYNFWTGERKTDGQRISVLAPIDQIPLFVPTGSILPLGPALQYANEKLADTIELRIYTGADGTFSLYEDEADNYNYEQGAYTRIPMHWSEKSKTLTLGKQQGGYVGMLQRRTFNIVFVEQGVGVGANHSTLYHKTLVYTGKEIKVTRE